MNADEIEALASSITIEMTPDQVCEVILKVNGFIDRAKKAVDSMKGMVFNYLLETNQTLTIGNVRYYLDEPRETKCRDQAEALQTLVETFGPKHVGEQFLSSGAFKHGACKKELDPETYDRLFEVVTKKRLIIEYPKVKAADKLPKAEPPTDARGRQLQIVDTTFIPRPRSDAGPSVIDT